MQTAVKTTTNTTAKGEKTESPYKQEILNDL